MPCRELSYSQPSGVPQRVSTGETPWTARSSSPLPPYSAALSAAQSAALIGMHPSGQARFFGAARIHDRAIRQLSAGDVILVTEGKRVRAVGELSVIL